MLTETEAFALLEHYCEPLHGSDWANAGYDRTRASYSVAREQADIVVRAASATSTRHARSLGAHLRLAFGVAQAVSCCRGLDPETDMAFWRHVVATLWLHEHCSPDRLVLSRTTFHHVGMNWNLESTADDTFWVGFFYGTPACDAVLSAVLHKLRPNLEVEPLPPLRVALSSCSAFSTIYAPQSLPFAQKYERDLPYGVVRGMGVAQHGVWSMVRAAQIAPVATTWSHAPSHLGLVIYHRVGFGASVMRRTLALLRRRAPHEHLQLSIDRLTIELAPLKPPRAAEPGAHCRRALVSRARPLGELLRGLLVAREDALPRVRTVASTGCSYTDYRHVGAALSAVALASPPIPELRCHGLFDGIEHRDNLLRLAWLAYTLHRRGMVTRTPLALVLQCTGVSIDESERAYITQLLALGTPLRDVVGEALRLRLGGDDNEVAQLHVACVRLGSTVRLTRGTQLCFEPFRKDDDDFVAVATDATQDETLDLVAHVADCSGNGCVGVVYAGFGLVWAPAASVVACRQIDDDMVMAMAEDPEARSDGLPLASLTLRFEYLDPAIESLANAFRVTRLLPLLACEALTSLILNHTVLTRDDLAHILDFFPRLEALNLDRCVVECVGPLADVYRRGATAISKLSLLSVRDLRFRKNWVNYSDNCSHANKKGSSPHWFASFLEAIVASRGGHRVLRELSLDFRGQASETAERGLVAQLAQALASNALVLVRLHVQCCGQWPTMPLEVLGLLRDAVVRDPPRVRCAVLSVLRAFGCATREVTRVVLALVEGGVTRRITWYFA